MNRSVLDTRGELLVVSQFTLLGDARKGRRPSFVDAARPEDADRLYLAFVERLRGSGLVGRDRRLPRGDGRVARQPGAGHDPARLAQALLTAAPAASPRGVRMMGRPAMPEEQRLGHYRLKDRLGSGAMGEVWLAEDTRLHRLVALKRLAPAAVGDGEAEARLLREARVASNLTHPNVAVVYDVGEAVPGGGGEAYIAMEYVRGRTLAERLREGPLEPEAALQIVEQVARALAEAHEHGIVHRDVKPGNVMLGERGVVKVLDFGLARYAPPAHEDSLTWSGRHGALEGLIVGTLAYMSPEQARGRAVDARSDVFSLGVVLYELLTRRRPFVGKNAVEQVEAILTKEPQPISAESPLAAGLGELALRMIEKEPARRPQRHARGAARSRGALEGRGPRERPGRDHTVAVIGFANVTGRAEDAWLGTGLAESVSAGLASVPGLVVVSRERVLEVLRELGLPAERDDAALAVRVGREVGARGVVTGAYQSLGERVRVTARVCETASGRVLLHPQVDGAPRGDLRAAGPAGGRDHERAAPEAARRSRAARGDAEPAGLRGLLEGDARPALREPGGDRPRAGVLRARDRARSGLRAGAHDARRDARPEGRLPVDAGAQRARPRPARPRARTAPRLGRGLALPRRRLHDARPRRGGAGGLRDGARPQPAGRLRALGHRPRAFHPARRLRARDPVLRARARAQPPRGLERAAALALRHAGARLRARRGGRRAGPWSCSRRSSRVVRAW